MTLPAHLADSKSTSRVSSFSFEVRGIPGPQGSKRHVGNGVMVESSLKVKPWREAVKWAYFARKDRVKIGGPVVLIVDFTLPRPKSAPKSRRWPDRKPDLDKLVRSTKDALTVAGAYEDDARVVGLLTFKRYVGDPNPRTLSSPGAVIRIQEAA